MFIWPGPAKGFIKGAAPGYAMEDSMSAHGDYQPEETRKSLSHPVIDGDGHWIEYTPVFAEKMRKVVGDKGADGFLAAQRFIPDTLRLTIAERKERGVGMQGYWGRQSNNTRER